MAASLWPFLILHGRVNYFTFAGAAGGASEGLLLMLLQAVLHHLTAYL
jgi:hypothetical protein